VASGGWHMIFVTRSSRKMTELNLNSELEELAKRMLQREALARQQQL
jgi:hypothetical protein